MTAIEIKGKITRIAIKKEYGTYGIQIDNDTVSWYNGKLIDGISLPSDIDNGDKVTFMAEPASFGVGRFQILDPVTVLEKAPKQEGFKTNSEFDEDKIKLEDLLNAAHDSGKLNGIETKKITQEAEYAEFTAYVHMKNIDKPFMGTGTCFRFVIPSDITDPKKLKSLKKLRDSYVLIAESRAIARALRWATNNAAVSDIEMDNGEDHENESGVSNNDTGNAERE